MPVMAMMAGWVPELSGFLQFFFVGLLLLLVAVVGLFFLYVAGQLFRNPGRHDTRR